ncbi:tRNA lysidine(34) synthetase TilS [Pseudomonas sp. 148P]|uniref:tRNA(Ile)-lysidine synthase n=1 Tax=Pseudomonas ulcerans TaxID=3115852 RepID=A0ABU7HVA9_9PSED|nr:MULTISPECIES: tRNA lysidine(34) synthetase TilS [unclassified Pseudomonas]MEE1924311.1 tRNA lysidine(34) synthetase TilS [Pseudomonas sp. 147P]MEE1935480.1 tRNA lysidine(34) synthetase TilS [Pseudomonas sp. 148P]
MTDLASRVQDKLAPWRDAPCWCVALSGGLDSTVLLHVLATLKERPALRAIHVHHGLQHAADVWPEHCQRLCDALGVELLVRRVKVVQGASLEQAARDARYQAFAEVLQPGELLLTGQHREDQAETLLLRLLRGAGLRGLAAMPECRSLAAGLLVRPLLDISRDDLLAFALAQGLSWVEDPSNADTRFNRNYLRHQVLPALTSRWPQASRSLARASAHLAEAGELLDELARDDLARAQGVEDFSWLGLPSLHLPPLARLSPARQRNALQFWLSRFTRLPDTDHWAGWSDLRDARVDASPVWKLTDGELHRADERCYWLSGAWLDAPDAELTWDDPQQALLLPGNGSVVLSGTVPLEPLRIAYRQGGESMNIPGRGHRDLKRLLNERQVPSFVRSRLPLLFAGERLVAVANLPDLTDGDLQLVWSVPTSEQGLR